MATVNKNFRIKHGLIVEGTTGTINGENILTEGSGDQYIINLIGGSATSENTPSTVVLRDVNGDFAAGTITANRINFGTVGYIEDDDSIEIVNTGDDINLRADDIRLQADDDVRIQAGYSGSIDGDIILETDGGKIRFDSSDIFVGNDSNFPDSDRVATQGYVDDAISNIDLTYTTDDVTEGSNLYFTNQRALDATASAYDAAGSAAAAQTAAQNYADGLAVNYDAAGSAAAAQTAAQNYADGLAVNYDAAGAAATAQSNAEFYTNNAIGNLSGIGTASVDGNIDVLTGTGINVNGGNNSVEIDRQTVDTWYDAAGAAATAQQAAELYTDNAVSALVDSAPAMLDTLGELATALQQNPDIISDLQDIAAGKQDTLTAGSNIDITGSTISVTGLDSADISDFNSAALSATSAAYDAAGAAAAAQTAAEGYADGLTDDMLDGTTPFSDININDVAKQIAARSTSLGSVPVTAYQFNKTNFKSGKFLVKIDNGTHNEISEILVTLDSSDNVAITEYAIVGTNGSRGVITADVDSTHCRIRVTPTDNSTITVSGTVFKS